jgi:ABC-2 type transport system permease protein
MVPMGTRLATWWTILRIGLEERLVYRGDFALGTLMRFLPVVTQVFLWYAIFQARLDHAADVATSSTANATPENGRLRVSKSASTDPPSDRKNVAFTLTLTVQVANNGTAAAGNVVIDESLPEGLTFVESSSTQGEYDSQTGQWNVGELTAGSTQTLTILAQPTLAGYSYGDFVAYYLLTMVARAFSSMPGLSSGIARTILSGDIKKYLTQPVDMLGFLLIGRIAHKLAYYAVAIGPFALVFFLCRNYFEHLPDAPTWAAFLASLVLGFVLGYFLESCMGLVGFWFGEIGSLLFVYMLFTFFLSGHMFPLDMLPGGWRTFVMSTPLMYLAYFPAAVFLGKIHGAELWQCLAIEAAWVAFFIIMSRVLFQRGLIKYSAYGG